MFEDFMNNGTRERRARCLLAFVLAMFGVLGVRLYSLQIGDWERYRIQSEKNTMQPVPLEASRGLIRDRNGVILVDNRPSYTISVIPPRFLKGLETADRDAGIRRLSDIVDLPESVVRRKLAKRKDHFYEPVKLKRDVEFGAVSLVEEERYDLTGVEIQVESRRGYPQYNGEGTMAAHLLGYVGLIDPDEYPRLAPLGYRYDDQIGKRGVERLTERMLRGRDGLKYIEVNAHGREVGSFPDKIQPAQPGRDAILTIDARLQSTAESVFTDSLSGSLIAIDPRNGELLAVVSKPDFHPRAIRDPDAWEQLKSGTHTPLLNRAIQGEYAPASIFKMISGIAALDIGILQPGEIRFPQCVGEFEFGDRIFRCHVATGCGVLDLRGALRQSCDSFFYHLGLELGIANWNRYARLFGIGQHTGIDIADGGDGESRGLLPDRAYYVEKKGRYFDGNMLNLAIGQGETLVTPMQIARYNAALATGSLVTPHILKNSNSPQPTEAVRVPAKTLQLIRDMMVDIVHYGTGRRGRLPGIDIAGKTGTAQNPHGEDHAWFIAFAPAESPEIAISVLVENGGQGGSVAAPLARQVFERYFEIKQQDGVTQAQVAAALEADRQTVTVDHPEAQ
jgi:penicillin-binding protein 2